MKVYLIVFSPDCSAGTYMFAETLEFINDAHVKVSGYFVFNDDVKEYLRLKKENAAKKTLIIPQSSYSFIEEIEVED
ncbi:hypothetical protein SAMN06265339_0805 [Desulfurobacterium pacificum]|uniref:Uncharacterized protein n=1 Tax=Desulfurobacterium pacificum TaxID=240166 RepID=A0ABY1NI69_9BACT|nr:hypothetical protein [Desulfurobacterium pacificum]SMP10430.1 hypothetical protein SAMN06265339_0805 [Desulfurobacterium pacificum]